MSTIRTSTQISRRHFLAGVIHKNKMLMAQFSTKMPWIRPMPALKFNRMATNCLGLNGQQLRCFSHNQHGSDEQLVAEFHNATTKSAPTMQEMKTTAEDHGTLQFQFRHFHCPNEQFKLSVKYKKGNSGRKFLEFTKHISSKFHSFPHVHVPEDVFGFVQAMDELLGVLEAKKNKIKAANKAHLHTIQAKGQIYDYQMKLAVYNRIVDVQLHKIPNAASRKHQPKRMTLQIPAFHWLRQSIGELFAANGEEHIQLQLGEPPALPAWLRLDSPMHVLPANNSRIPLQQPHGIMATQPQNVLMKSAEAVDEHRTFAQRSVPLDQHGQQNLNAHYRMGRSDQKFIDITKALGNSKFYDFAKINVPEDVFAFMQAMDRLLNSMAANKDIIETHTNQPRSSQLVLQTVKATGKNYDFELDLYINKDGQVEVAMRSVPNQAAPEHKPRRMYLPLRHFHWLRHAIGEILAENGMRLGKTPHYPGEWLSPDNMRNALFPENHQKLPRQQQQQNRTNFSQPPQQWQSQQRRIAAFGAQPQQHAQLLMGKQSSQEQLTPTAVEMERLHRLVLQQQRQLKQMQTAMDRMAAEQRRELKNNEQKTELINLLHRNLNNLNSPAADEQSNRNSSDE